MPGGSFPYRILLSVNLRQMKINAFESKSFCIFRKTFFQSALRKSNVIITSIKMASQACSS